MRNKLLLSCLLAFTFIITIIFCTGMFFAGNGDVSVNKPLQSDDVSQNISSKGIATSSGKGSAIELSVLTSASPDTSTQKPEQKRISFIACGDNIVHSTILADSRDNAYGTDEEFEFVSMFENVADIIDTADLAYINQESPFGGPDRKYTGYPMFSSPDKVGYDLMELGFNIINLANNHMLDAGTASYQRTIDFWKDKPVLAIGGFENKEDYENIRILDKDGIKIAFLSYTYGTNGLSLKSGSDMVIPLCDDASTGEIDRQSKKARELADIVIVSMHWGNEDWFQPSALQKKQMNILVNNGVDVIIGTHPHVLEPMFWQQRPDGKRTLVMYSIGNFMSGMEYMRNMVGGIAGFDIVKFGNQTFIDSPYFIPTISHCNTSWRKFKIYKVSEYTKELFDSHRCQRISDPGRSLEYIYNIIDRTIPDEFLIEDFYKDKVGKVN